jgi:hypothetical protein
MSQKKINYLARTFSDYRAELINFSNKYYPELSDDFNDSSVGAWFIDLVSSVSDNLSYHIDRMYQETNPNTAMLKSSVLNSARSNGFKVPGAKASMCEVKLSCSLPVDPNDISSPDWEYAPVLRRTSTVAAGNYNFHLTEDVDFKEQFNSEAFSNRTFTPNRNSNGSITSYTVSKTTIAINGTTRVFKKVLTNTDIKPFMEIVLPDTNVMNVESIIFKESADFSQDPDIQEYYYDDEQYKTDENAAMTYRYFEVDSLADQWRFGSESNFDNNVIKDTFNPEVYEDYTETDTFGDTTSSRTSRYYKGKWKPITQKFITEYTDNGYMKVIFGSGIDYRNVPTGSTKYGEYRASKIINNDMLGVLPKQGWTMYILYEVGGGAETNLGAGAINSISLMNAQFHSDGPELLSRMKGQILNSMSVTNLTPSVAGKDAPSVDEIKYLTKYNTSSQERCVTLKDYKTRLMMMPPKYGAPYRSAVIEDNNKISMSLLGLNSLGKLDKSLPEALVNNILEYMSHYRSINDYIEVKSGRIYNIGFSVDVFIDKSYNSANVVSNIINKIKDYMDVEKHDMGEDIFIGDLEKEITLIDGVLSLISLRVYNIYSQNSGNYSTDKAPYPMLNEQTDCKTTNLPVFNVSDGSQSYPIDLDAIDRVLYSDYNSMFEILNPTNDIQIRVKLK